MWTHFICFFLLLACANADYHGMIKCHSSQQRRGSLIGGTQPNDAELDLFNDLLGDFLSAVLDKEEILHHLIFDCRLAKDRKLIKKHRKSFEVVEKIKIEGDGSFNITSLADLFLGVAGQVVEGIEKLPQPGWKECFGACLPKRKTYLFGCDYSIIDSNIITKCVFERRKLK